MAAVLIPQHSTRTPEPNPHFVFPLGLPVEENDKTPCGLPKGSSTRRRPQHLSFDSLPPPLPPFDFHATPPTSANSSSGSPKRSPGKPIVKGHRRNGSEFIGGDIRNGGSGIMSTSPTKTEGALPPPPLDTKAPNKRRGHAHKRSGAVSGHDLSSILSAPRDQKTNSLPTTPSLCEAEKSFPPPLPTRSASHPEGTAASSSKTSATSLEAPLPIPASAIPRPRVVGFADKLEYITRPLSTISSETSSSMSTIRQSHSVSGSVTSINREGTPSPPTIEDPLPRNNFDDVFMPGQMSQSPGMESNQIERPSSIETLIKGKGNSETAEEQCLSELPNPMSENTPTADNLALILSPYDDAHLMVTSRDQSQSFDGDRGEGFVGTASVPLASEAQRPRTTSPSRRPNSSPASKSSKVQKAHRSWTDPFRSRRLKPPVSENKAATNDGTTSTSDPLDATDAELSSVDMEDSVCLPRYTLPWAAVPGNHNLPAQQLPFTALENTMEDSAEVIDLDALFTGSDIHSRDIACGTSSMSHKHRMYSSTPTRGLTGISGYHRRADSAPEMPLLPLRGLGFSRLGSNSAMADVFEEDEEDEGPDSKIIKSKATSRWTCEANESHSFAETVRHDTVEIKEPALALKRAGSCHARIPSNDNTSKTDYADSEPASAITQESGPFTNNVQTTPIDIVGCDEEPRINAPSHFEMKVAQQLCNVPVLMQSMPTGDSDLGSACARRGSFRTINTEQMSSTVSSPDFGSTSFDDPRLDTARSSITDRTTLTSFRNGNPSSYRGSVDDVPSLTSAASCSTSMTGESPTWSKTSAQSAGPTASVGEHRNFSAPLLTSPHQNSRPATASKRASLASLSKLMGANSHSERSKLNIEHRPVSQEGKDGREKKRGNRLSKLMNFFRSKERQAM